MAIRSNTFSSFVMIPQFNYFEVLVILSFMFARFGSSEKGFLEILTYENIVNHINNAYN